MTKRKRRSSKKTWWPGLKQLKWPQLSLSLPRFPDLPWRAILVSLVFVLSGFSLLALLSPTDGALTRAWAALLKCALGWAAYLLAVGLAAMAYWLGIRRRAIHLTRATGVALTLLSLLSITHLIARLPNPFTLSAAGYGGGYLGWRLSSLLALGFGRLGAYLFSLAILATGIIITFDLSFARARSLAVAATSGVRERWRRPSSPRAKRRRRATASKPRPAASIPASEAIATAEAWAEELVPVEQVYQPELPTPNLETAGGNGERKIKKPERQTAGEPALPDIIPASPDSGWELPNLQEIFTLVDEEALSDERIEERMAIIEETLGALGVPAQVVEAQKGPAITQFAVRPGHIEKRTSGGAVRRMRVRVNKITALADDLALALSAAPVRIQAPIPGRSVIGIEVPNSQTQTVSLGGVLFSPEFQRLSSSPLALALGREISGRPLVADLARMPHLLMAGATGAGKSVAINAIICCLLARNTPDSLRLVLIDPKRVELANYNGVPHLVGKVVSAPEEAVAALKWATREMDRRYAAFSDEGVRDLRGYNNHMEKEGNRPLPRVVVIVDELADLMMSSAYEVERTLCRLAQMARATGIHLVVSTQRPSVDVLTGLIKANFPARIAFAVSSNTDSRVILDSPGAERLLGKGDMLFMSPSNNRLTRAQGCFVADEEINQLCRFWKRAGLEANADPDDHFIQAGLWSEENGEEEDPLLDQAIEVIEEEGRASTTMLQRHLSIGYNRAARMMDTLIDMGIISVEADGPYNSHSLLSVDDNEGTEGGEEESEVAEDGEEDMIEMAEVPEGEDLEETNRE